MGVISTSSLPAGRVYGPIPPHVTLTDPIVTIGHMTTDSRPDVHTVKINPDRYREGQGLAEWLPYVQAARDEREQNVEALLKDGQLFYRIVRPVQENTELMVWYSGDLATIIGVPEIHTSYIKDGGSFCCPYCRAWFRFPNCLRAHMRFKCESSRHIYCTNTTTKATTNINLSLPTPPMYHSPASLASSSSPPSSASPPYHPRASPPVVRTREDGGLSEGGISPGSTSSGVSSSSLSPPNSAEKRKREDDDVEDAIISSKRFLGQDRRGNLSPGGDSKYSKSPSPTSEESSSAFHKVEQRSIKLGGGSPPTLPVVSQQQQVPHHFPPHHPVFQHPSLPNPYAMAAAAQAAGFHNMMRPPVVGAYPIVSTPSSSHQQHIQHSQPSPPSSHPSQIQPFQPGSAGQPAYKENVPVSLSDITRLANGLPVRARIPGMDAIAASGKIPFHPDWRFHFPYYKSQNPIVEKILQSATQPQHHSPPSLALMQNWCAKCNATFRMTSDLVYHMRSHHKNEFLTSSSGSGKGDSGQVEGKLECNVCGERFKERHHLTRHMTSHQDGK